MKIAYIDGGRLKRALIAGSSRVVQNANHLNAINVFPVPDGDTGTNMAGTVDAMSIGLSGFFPEGVGSVARRAADFALQGARGNSGAILAQFFHGLAEELAEEARVGSRRFAQAARAAAARAREALSKPREGTLVTVLHDWAEALHQAAQRTEDFAAVFGAALESARRSLAKTTELLPELRRANVVDAGAQGFVHLLEGIMHFLQTGRIRDIQAMPHAEVPSAYEFPLGDFEGEETYRYCTEVLASGKGMDPAAIRALAESFGDSVVVAGSEQLLKIHVHTDRPFAVFDALDGLTLANGSGISLSAHKVDDMKLQKRLASRPRQRCAIVVDSSCDLSEAFRLELGVTRVPLQLNLNGKYRPDGEGIDLDSLLERMRSDPDLQLSTSQPTDAAFSRGLRIASAEADEVLYIGLASVLSGTYGAGERASRAFDGKVNTYDAKTLSVGYAALAAAAARAASAGASSAEILERLHVWRRRLGFYVAVPNLTSLIRSGRLKGLKSVVLRRFGIRPILTTDEEGKADSGGLYFGPKNGVRKLVSLVTKRFPAGQAYDIHIGHVDAERDASELAGIMDSRYQGSSISITELGPVLSSLGWLGTLGVAVLPREREDLAGAATGSSARESPSRKAPY